jgi:hypothetical protein
MQILLLYQGQLKSEAIHPFFFGSAPPALPPLPLPPLPLPLPPVPPSPPPPPPPLSRARREFSMIAAGFTSP